MEFVIMCNIAHFLLTLLYFCWLLLFVHVCQLYCLLLLDTWISQRGWIKNLLTCLAVAVSYVLLKVWQRNGSKGWLMVASKDTRYNHLYLVSCMCCDAAASQRTFLPLDSTYDNRWNLILQDSWWTGWLFLVSREPFCPSLCQFSNL